MLDLSVCARLINCPSFKLSLPLVEMFYFGGFFFLSFCFIQWHLRDTVFMIPHVINKKKKGNVSLRWTWKEAMCFRRVIFSVLFLCVISNGCCACWCISFFFFFWICSSFYHFYTSCPPKIWGNSIFFSQMSYRLTFKFLSEQSDYLIFVWNLTEVSHFNVIFF